MKFYKIIKGSVLHNGKHYVSGTKNDCIPKGQIEKDSGSKLIENKIAKLIFCEVEEDEVEESEVEESEVEEAEVEEAEVEEAEVEEAEVEEAEVEEAEVVNIKKQKLKGKK